jgi:hypothetical protein
MAMEMAKEKEKSRCDIIVRRDITGDIVLSSYRSLVEEPLPPSSRGSALIDSLLALSS